MAGLALDQGNLALARQATDEASAAQGGVSDPRALARGRAVGGYASRLGAWETAARLYAAAEQGRSRTHDLVDPAERDLRARDRAAALDALGPAAFLSAEQADGPLALSQALELACSTLTQIGLDTC